MIIFIQRFLLISLFFPDSNASCLFQEKNLEWFPRMRAMSLVSNEGDNEQNEMRSLQEKLTNTVTLISQLSSQLAELKEQVTSGPLSSCLNQNIPVFKD